MSSSINLASGLAPAAEISASNDEQDASGLAPDATNFVKNQTYDYSFVSSAGLAPAVLTIAKIMGSDLPTRFGPVGFCYNINKLIVAASVATYCIAYLWVAPWAASRHFVPCPLRNLPLRTRKLPVRTNVPTTSYQKTTSSYHQTYHFVPEKYICFSS